jgi:hypothetical protein
MDKINYISTCHRGSVSVNQKMLSSNEVWRVTVPVEGNSDHLSYCLKMARGSNNPVPIVVYRFSGKEILPELDKEALLNQQNMIFRVRIFEQEAKKYEELLKKEYPDYIVISISSILTYEV